MGYRIEPLSIISFLDENNMQLPRFQRKSTWDKKQNFELAISVFQDYPVGVVIVNKEKDSSWLLDGRQRRNALEKMRSNPIELYEWARSYVGFSKTEDEAQLRKYYWDKVEKYLSTDIAQDNNDETDDVVTYEGEDPVEDETSFDRDKQKKGLTTLLDLILMVHQNKPSGSKWEKTFDFIQFFPKLRYVDRTTKRIKPAELRSFLLELNKKIESNYQGKLTEDNFVSVYEDTFFIDDSNLPKFKNEVNKNWQDIEKSIKTIVEAEKVFSDARIGIIWLTNASPLDAQNIFSRVNKGGTQLKAEELLSAKPYWNKPVNVTNNKVKALIDGMYEKLDVKSNNIVRWDIPATLISRINDFGLLFEKNDDKAEVSMEQITLGFKLVSSMMDKGMSAKSVIDLENDEKINWVDDIDDLVSEINTICQIIKGLNFFKTLNSWNKPMTKLLGNAIALEFIAILKKDWDDKGKPTVSGNAYKTFQRDAEVLFDRLVFEYSTKVWRGSGDSKMANDIKNWKARLSPITKTEWENYVDGVCDGAYNGQNTTVKLLRPILYYSYVLQNKTPTNQSDVEFDVDHIIPQEALKNNQFVPEKFKDSLSNLALLPKKDNISKKSKRLNEITEPWLKDQVEEFSNIKKSDFEKYSDVNNWFALVKERKDYFKDIFGDKRDTMLAN